MRVHQVYTQGGLKCVHAAENSVYFGVYRTLGTGGGGQASRAGAGSNQSLNQQRGGARTTCFHISAPLSSPRLCPMALHRKTDTSSKVQAHATHPLDRAVKWRPPAGFAAVNRGLDMPVVVSTATPAARCAGSNAAVEQTDVGGGAQIGAAGAIIFFIFILSEISTRNEKNHIQPLNSGEPPPPHTRGGRPLLLGHPFCPHLRHQPSANTTTRPPHRSTSKPATSRIESIIALFAAGRAE